MDRNLLLEIAVGAIIVIGVMEIAFRYYAWKDKKNDNKNKKR